MAALEQEAMPEAVTPSPAREPPQEPEVDAPSTAAVAGKDLQPWEQHAAVINLPRYDYRASGSLLLQSCSGFLITCPIKREKSATKEAISILEEYRTETIWHFVHHLMHCSMLSDLHKLDLIFRCLLFIGHSNVSENSGPCDVKIAAKKRKLCSDTSEDLEQAATNGNNDASESTGSIGNSNSPQSKTREDVDKTSKLSLVKLSRSGLLFFKFPSGGFQVVQMLTEMLDSLRSEKLKPPQWCHRIFPIQETCVLSETELHATVSELFLDFLSSKKDRDEPIKFAVAYNRRGIEETKMKPPKNSNEGSNQQALMDREQCFRVVAAAIKSVAENSVVDLRSPEVAVLVEMLPLSGVPLGSSVVGVSILPAELIATKPRLCVKALVSDAKATKK